MVSEKSEIESLFRISCQCLLDAVDNGQNKKAIQLADKILKKESDLQCARVRNVKQLMTHVEIALRTILKSNQQFFYTCLEYDCMLRPEN